MSDKWSELERLARLRTEGALTDDEFELEKRRLLQRRPSWRGLLLGGSVALLAATASVGVWRLTDASGSSHGSAGTEGVGTGDRVAGAAEPPVTLQRAFDIAFPTARREVLVEGERVGVRFTPSSLYRLRQDAMVLLSKGENLDEDYHASSGFYAISYLTTTPKLALQGPTFIGTGSRGGWGKPPDLRVTSDLLGLALVEVISSSSSGSSTAVSIDLVSLAASSSDVGLLATGVPMAFTDAGQDRNCEIHGRLVANGPASFKVVYSGSYAGEAIYRRGQARYETPASPYLYERCPSPADDR